MKKVLLCILITSLSLCLMILLSPIRSIGINISILTGFFAYFFFTILILNKFSRILKLPIIFLCLLLGLSMIEIPMRIKDFQATLLTLPDFIFHILGIVNGYIFYRFKGFVRWGTTCLLFTLAVFMLLEGEKIWTHQLNFGTFTDAQNYTPDFQITGKTGEGLLLNSNSFKGKIVLFDFWHSKCGACYNKFPILEAFYTKEKDNANLLIYAFNKPLKGDSAFQAFNEISKRDFHFPVLLPTDIDLPEKFGVFLYPTTIILNKEGRVIFKGELEDAIDLINKIGK
ncbi:MAG: TlpA disulfide reductase family protein [Sphingobacteriales bacterium]|nr:TlpA disulfide reductase family protein [Sphingobacteriales bacterium]